jgi:hypothetical protein
VFSFAILGVAAAAGFAMRLLGLRQVGTVVCE